MIDKWSLEAYRRLIPSLPEREAEVVNALMRFSQGVTADSLAATLGRRKDHIMPRLTGLKDRGVVEKLAKAGVSRYGRTCNLWKLVPLGRRGRRRRR